MKPKNKHKKLLGPEFFPSGEPIPTKLRLKIDIGIKKELKKK